MFGMLQNFCSMVPKTDFSLSNNYCVAVDDDTFVATHIVGAAAGAVIIERILSYGPDEVVAPQFRGTRTRPCTSR